MAEKTRIIGIPRALAGYLYLPLWVSFFQSLGEQVVISGETTRATLDDGVRLAVDEACLPVKIYYGHVAQLIREKVDYLFLPRLVQVEKGAFICPKFMGLPDMIGAGIPGVKGLMDPLVDVRKKSLAQTAEEVGQKLGRPRFRSWLAFHKAVQVHQSFLECMRQEQAGLEELLPSWVGAKPRQARPTDLYFLRGNRPSVSAHDGLTVGVLGHPYNVYDPMVNMRLFKVLSGWGVKAVTADMMTPETIDRGRGYLPKDIFWTFGRHVAGAAYYWLNHGGVDGIIHLVSFGCGPDSLVGELLQRETARGHKTPFLLLTVDEHTGEAGFLTRVEAFLDMIRRKKEVASCPR